MLTEKDPRREDVAVLDERENVGAATQDMRRPFEAVLQKRQRGGQYYTSGFKAIQENGSIMEI